MTVLKPYSEVVFVNYRGQLSSMSFRKFYGKRMGDNYLTLSKEDIPSDEVQSLQIKLKALNLFKSYMEGLELAELKAVASCKVLGVIDEKIESIINSDLNLPTRLLEYRECSKSYKYLNMYRVSSYENFLRQGRDYVIVHADREETALLLAYIDRDFDSFCVQEIVGGIPQVL